MVSADKIRTFRRLYLHPALYHSKPFLFSAFFACDNNKCEKSSIVPSRIFFAFPSRKKDRYTFTLSRTKKYTFTFADNFLPRSENRSRRGWRWLKNRRGILVAINYWYRRGSRSLHKHEAKETAARERHCIGGIYAPEWEQRHIISHGGTCCNRETARCKGEGKNSFACRIRVRDRLKHWTTLSRMDATLLGIHFGIV